MFVVGMILAVGRAAVIRSGFEKMNEEWLAGMGYPGLSRL